MKAKKRTGKPAAKRAAKDLSPKKTSTVKGGFEAVEHSVLGAGGKRGGGANSGSFYEALAKAWGEALDKP